MDQDISSAADALALQRIQAQDYRTANAQAAARAAAEAQAVAEWRAQNIALSERQVAVVEREAAKLATPDQETWLRLFQININVRLGPTVISTSTPTSVILDIATDPVSMTVAQWPLVKAELDKLAPLAANQ